MKSEIKCRSERYMASHFTIYMQNRYLIYYIRYKISDVLYKISYILNKISYILNKISYLQYLIS